MCRYRVMCEMCNVVHNPCYGLGARQAPPPAVSRSQASLLRSAGSRSGPCRPLGGCGSSAFLVGLWYDLVLGRSYWVEDDGSRVLRTEIEIDTFRGFVVESEPRLRQALSATLGTQVGREATADAMSYAWENWERIQLMQNPVGYLFAVGRDRGRKSLRRKRPVFYQVPSAQLPWVEPSLPSALERLPDRQREVVVLLHCYQWSMSEVADLLGISKSTVQNHAERGLASLRLAIGVEA